MAQQFKANPSYVKILYKNFSCKIYLKSKYKITFKIKQSESYCSYKTSVFLWA